VENMNFLDLYRALDIELKKAFFGLVKDDMTNDQLEEQFNRCKSPLMSVETAKDQLRIFKHNIQLKTVILFSGPGIYISTLGKLFDQQAELNKFVYFMQYSANQNNFNMMLKEAKHAPASGISNELSWTTLGEFNKQQRELQIEKAAICMQRFFRRKFCHKLTKPTNVMGSTLINSYMRCTHDRLGKLK
jgi:predicted PolB exonuclease-like 3'-5' exonuclease